MAAPAADSMQKDKPRRIDQLLVERGLTESREQAQRLLLAGAVLVDGQPVSKAGQRVDPARQITLAAREQFVSRGGLKLQKALDYFSLPVTGRICLDVGASTGGFTDCLLQHGAARVLAVDVGQGLLHWRLRQDARVTLLEKINARHLAPADLPAVPDLATVDVSFISLTKILPAVNRVLPRGSQVVALIKPQFEAGREQVRRGGVVRDPAVRAQVVERIRAFGETAQGWQCRGVCESPITGPAGNVEFLILWEKP